MNTTPKAYTVKELASALSVSVSTIRRTIANGSLPAIRDHRGLKISEATVLSFLRGELKLSTDRAGKKH